MNFEAKSIKTIWVEFHSLNQRIRRALVLTNTRLLSNTSIFCVNWLVLTRQAFAKRIVVLVGSYWTVVTKDSAESWGTL